MSVIAPRMLVQKAGTAVAQSSQHTQKEANRPHRSNTYVWKRRLATGLVARCSAM